MGKKGKKKPQDISSNEKMNQVKKRFRESRTLQPGEHLVTAPGRKIAGGTAFGKTLARVCLVRNREKWVVLGGGGDTRKRAVRACNDLFVVNGVGRSVGAECSVMCIGCGIWEGGVILRG